ncbi:MAG: flagellar basal body protein [Phycisphaerales bacterium]|nr:flagellar basal body protein [Phycisphaerales bacterium]
MTGVINIALSGLNRNAIGVHTVANNVANVNTNGFRAQRLSTSTDTTTPRYDAAEAPLETASDTRPPSDVDLATEFVDLKRYEIGYRANATVLTIADRLSGELLDLVG